MIGGRIATALYVPGDRPDRFNKAADSGAQMIILDLEDAVAEHRKNDARRSVVDWLVARSGTSDGPVVQVRVNQGDLGDLDALRHIGHPIELRIPKIESVADLDAVAEHVEGRPITALIESALGMEHAFHIASHPLVTRIALGESDLASDLGSGSPALIDHARLRLLFAARAAGLPVPMLSVYPDIRNLDGLRTDTERGRDLGWFGRSAIHPSQLAVIARVFERTGAELAWANEVLAATSAGGVTTLASGEMVDNAMIGRALAILGRGSAAKDPGRSRQFPEQSSRDKEPR